MRLNSLRLLNFRQHADTTIQFGGGLTGIIGPNGAGKSTILEAIAWILYGTPAARGNRDGIRSLRAPPRAAVRGELDFELGGHRYRVVRGLTNAELYLDGGSQPIANSITSVSDLLRRRLGMTLDEFFNTYFTGQKELAVMAAMGPTDRGQFLSRVLGYERLRAAQAIIRDRRKLLVAEAAGLEQGMANADDVARAHSEASARCDMAQGRATAASRRVAAARREVDAIAPRWEETQRKRDVLRACVADLALAESDLASIARERERVEREIGEIAVARTELDGLQAELAPLGEARIRLADVELLAREEGKRQTLARAEEALLEDIRQLQEKQQRLMAAPELEVAEKSEVERRRGEVGEIELRLDSVRTEWIRDRQEAQTKIDQLKTDLQEARQQRERLVERGEDGTCPTCGRPLETHYRSVLELIDERIDAITANGRYYRGRIGQLKEMPDGVRALESAKKAAQDALAGAEQRLARIQADLQGLATTVSELAAREDRHNDILREIALLPTGYDAAMHETIRLDVERLLPLEARAQRLEATLEREARLVEENDALSARFTQARDRTEALVARRDSMADVERAFVELGQVFGAADAELRAAELEAATAEGEWKSSRALLDSAETALRELERAKERLGQITAARRMHEELDRSYTDIRADLNQQVRPEIADIASGYLNELTDGRCTELELDEAYNIIVLEDGIPKPVISGGEADLANLSLRLAISRMIAERSGQPLSLLVFDEIFGSLDESRRNNVVDVLLRIHDHFDQIILITHVDFASEGLDHRINVSYDAETGSTRVDQAPMDGGDALQELTAGAA